MTRPVLAFEEILLAAAPAASLAIGEVATVDEDGAEADVILSGSLRHALVSVGSLIQPLAGDRVLTVAAGDELFIVQVLQRVGTNYATLALPGRGNLALEGETLSLSARQRLSLRSDRLDLQGRVLALIADKTTWLGKLLTGVVERFQISARSHETHADSLITKAVNRTVIVDQTDSLRAEMSVVKIAGVASETAQSKVIAVADDLRMDGKRITMG